MAVESSLASLYDKLKVEDPWLPPRPWESIPSESGVSRSRIASSSPSPSENRLFDTSTVSEASLVRLALNALQGLESAVISVEKLSAAFCSDPADRTSHRVNGLWNRSSSTHVLGNILKSIGFSGCMVFLLRKFVGYFMNLSLDGQLNGTGQVEVETLGIEGDSHIQVGKEEHLPFGLVNQAFAGSVNKVLEGYTCALDTLYASVGLRRSSEAVPMPHDVPHHMGSLTSVVLSKITLLEVYLHTKEVRTQIEALGSICNLRNVALGFSLSSFKGLTAKAVEELTNFPRGSDLLSYLHDQLQAADPAHRALLKFLFVRSCEPYFGFIRSWIFKAEINDPYKEFMGEHVPDIGGCSQGEGGYVPGASVQVRRGISVPSFLKDFLVPIIRAGQQLQVLIKLFEFCNYIVPGINTYDDFLPCWKVFSDPAHTSPLTFSKRDIEGLVLSRNSYYNKMQEKLEEISTKLEFRYHQVGASGMGVHVPENFWGNLDAVVSFMLNDSPVAPPAADGERVDNMDSDDATSTCEADLLDSSYCSSSDCSNEQIESEEPIELPNGSSCPEDKYLSTLRFSRSSLEDKLDETNQVPCHEKSGSHEISERVDILGSIGPSHSDGAFSRYKSVDMEFRELTQSGSVLCHDNTWLKSSRFDLNTSNREAKHTGNIISFREMGPSRPYPKDGTLPNDAFDGATKTPNSFTLQSSDFRDSNFLSKNPMLSMKAFAHTISTTGASCCNIYGKSLPCFEFNSVEDAVRVCVEKLDGGCICEPECETSVKGNSDNVFVENTEALAALAEIDLKEHDKEDAISTNISGGSAWESLLGTLIEPVRRGVSRRREISSDIFEIPLDFIIEKCILQEIWLQYKYVSKLTIKLLDDGFDLRQHLLTLRRYHFMEVADWADLFIMSLWHHKSRGFATEAEQRASDIQGLLETSIQRSSCESNNYKDRLFVFFEEHDRMPLSASATGIHSFDFLHLGYRVNWPVSIILTPSALKIYAEIFNFLMKVKLAIFSLTDSWCLLKDLMHQTDRNCNSHLQELEASHVKTLINMRHQLNHFISMLQQYVQSQLSHVSWCRFLQLLKHKVKDMMDLESVHMEYLMDSLHICFLSEETRAIGSIIKNVLQYALDFRGCLVRGVHDTGARADLLDKVQTIKQKFDKNMEELQRIYLRSPKHGKFGISHFWGFLNCNEYYSNGSNQNTFFF
ncbi:uncharacterized protein LOC116200724 [Punica granatum]|uniref:Uncharacterized protein LOC116200724 n=4 Tax=Punica granatum TaxID=22663 RepID=A0A6P8D1C7_PUNGR|nr:uncharacterized protein LOC116200724 [Punica granatum]